MKKPLYTGSEWSMELIGTLWKNIEYIARKLGFDPYEPQIEIISSEQMLDCYSSVAMPVMYNHWSFGKTFIQNERQYNKGMQGLAYEVVINTNPCIAYLMENNTATLQALVLAHASVGHSHFFKNNYLFKGWTEAETIVGYLKFAKKYIKSCEEQYGEREVEKLLDACHALQNHGIDKYKKPSKMSTELKHKRAKKWEDYAETTFNDVWRTIPKKEEYLEDEQEDIGEENLLYFIEKHSPVLESWEKEIVRIVRKISQYFYPQRQTQLLNEGFACVKGDTEYLSPGGWKRIDEYKGEEVAQYEEDGTITFVKPSKYIIEDNKELLHIHGEGFDQCVTPDHRVPYLSTRGHLNIKTAETLPQTGYFIKGGSISKEEGLNLTEPELRIMIAVCADGHFNPNTTTKYVQFGFIKHRKIERLEALLFLADIPYNKTSGTQGRTFISFYAPERNKRLNEYYGASKLQLDIISDEVTFWDGNEKKGRKVFFGTNRSDADFIQYVFSVTGYSASLRIEKKHHSDMYFVERLHNNTSCIVSTSIDKLEGKHRVYCFTVPSGMFVTRRSNKVSITGNCYTHHLLMTEMHTQGLIDDGAYLEFLENHTNVVTQRDWDNKYYSGINVYALGFAMLKDIERMCTNPDEEDLKWFPDVCNTDPIKTILHIVENYRDESFVQQFLSPKIARHFKLFSVNVKEGSGYLKVNATHDDESFLQVRQALAAQYDLSRSIPQIEVVEVDWKGDRCLYLEHTTVKNQRLDYRDAKKTMNYLEQLWGFPVSIEYKDTNGGEINEF